MDDLVTKAQAGDAKALEKILTDAEKPIYRFGLRMCGNEDAAREVLQETMMAAFRALPGFRGESTLSTWLFQLARNACLRQRRKHVGEPEALQPLDTPEVAQQPSPAPGADERAHAKQMGGLLSAAVGALSAEHREVILLRDVEGLSAEEAASVLGIEVGALKSRLHRARMSLRDRLASVLDASPGAACPELAQELSQYAAQELDKAACEVIEKHLSSCPRCAAECEQLKRTVSLCRAIPGDDVPAPVKAAIRRSLQLA